MRTITVLALLLISAISPATARAATPVPSPSPSATATPTVAATATPAVTASAAPTLEKATSTPSVTPAPASARFTLSGRLLVDANGNGVADARDEPPRVVYLVLVPWSTADQILAATPVVPPVVPLYSAPDGSFVFEKLPADGYTLEVEWPFGFETKGASPAVPDWLRVVFRVTNTGDILPPDPLPKVWPGSLEPLVPGEPIIGALPNPILLKKIENPNVVTVPVFDNPAAAGPPPVGRVDVSAVLRGRRSGSVQLPSTGVASSPHDGWLGDALLAGAAIALIALAGALVRRAHA